ncbi:MAG: ABC transporter substrate-binding protein [Arcicella sp.]|nr:ABC transporter substrate-binding protein [Arcicella sp.]
MVFTGTHSPTTPAKAILLLLIFTYCSLLTPQSSQAQILNDAATRQQISQGLDNMYSYDFKESAEIFQKIKAKYPQHPVFYTLMAIQTELMYFPLKDYPAQQKTYLAYLNQSRALSEAMLDKNEEDVEATFFELATLGYLAAYDADNQEFMKAVGVAKKAYSYLKKGLVLTDKQPEFLYSSGIYNYYRVEYPETHPMIKSVIWMFADGNKKLGLQQLDLATRKTVFVKNEATFYAGYVYTKYESNFAKALTYNNILIEKHPNNLLYQMQRTEFLYAMGRYDDAEYFADKILKQRGIMFQCAGIIFKGLIAEKSKKDDKNAEILLLKGIKMPFDERFTKDYHALAYVGLARIAKRAGETNKMKEYAKKASKMAEYKSTLAEAKAILK